jgi:rod shape determining protein RodA
MLRKLFHFPASITIHWRLVLPIIILLSISLIILYSTSSQSEFLTSTFFKQLVWIGMGIIVFIMMQFVKLQIFYEYAYIFYGLLLIALLATYFMPIISGAHRWLIMGPLRIQPSEIGKLLVIFALAKFLTDQNENFDFRSVMIITFSIAAIPALLVFKQPDLGTAIVYLAVTVPMLYWAGLRLFYLFVVIAPFLSVASAFHIYSFSIWITLVVLVTYFNQPKLIHGVIIFLINIIAGTLSTFVWDKLYIHQQNRILTFLDPMRDPQGAGYQIIQSMTAIGSGGITGKGIGEGTQTHLRYLPVRDTDFIVSVAGEEMGLFGILVIIIAFFGLVYWLVSTAQKIHNHFASLVIIGISMMMFVHLLVNMGMTVGLFPVTGLPAPFISYGGSFLLTSIFAISICNNAKTYDM